MHCFLAHSLWVTYSSAGTSWNLLGFAPKCGLGLDIHKSPHSMTCINSKYVLLMAAGRNERDQAKHTTHLKFLYMSVLVC